MISIDLDPTRRLHERLAELSSERPKDVAEAIESANRSIRSRGVTFGGDKEMPISMSALLLGESDVQQLGQAARTLWRILEKTLDWIIADESRLDRYAGDHRRIFPWLRRTPGTATWQLFSRYDAVVTTEGRVRFIECNTGCPAGFLHAVDFTRESKTVLESLAALPDRSVRGMGMIRPSSLVDLLLAVEARSGIEPGIVGILTDENGLKLELDLLQRSLRDGGRDVRIMDARTLDYSGGRLRDNGDPISVAFQKVRISTPDSSNHCWKPGFESRYRSLLAAIRDDVVAPVNNLCALSVAEDKGMLANLFLPEIRDLLTADEQRFVDECVQWTARLCRQQVKFQGRTIQLPDYARMNKDRFVLKPANEGRGFEVFVGRSESESRWRELCQPNASMPMVVQEFAEPATFPAACRRPNGIQLETMHLTIALAMVDGMYEGILSRISPSIITNVGRQGFVQAVLVTE